MEREQIMKKEDSRRFEAPPIGVIPPDLWEDKMILERTKERIMDLKSAIERYEKAKQPVPKEWLDELKKRKEAIGDK